MWHLGVWSRGGYGGAGFMVELDDLEALFWL